MHGRFDHRHLQGQVRSYHVGQLPGPWSPNSILSSWGSLLMPLLAGDNPELYRLAGMYIEYENNGGVAVSPPEFVRTDDAAEYYEDLSLSSTRDYLRVPIIGRTSSRGDGFAFDNILTVTARTSGSTGVNGKPFSSAAQSRVYGGAAIAIPDESDATQDCILARFYWSNTSLQLVKTVGGEIGYDWKFTAN